jgi:CheY-like chemotaxis protein
MSTAMLVESGKQQRKVLSKLLEEEGLQVKSFATAEEAVDQVAQVAPELVIFDVKMPSISGIELLEQLRRYDLPVLLITANQALALKHDLYSVGDVVEGPVSHDTLLARIRGILKRRQSRSVGPAKVFSAQQRVSSHVVPELHDPVSGRLSASRIAEFLGVSLSSLAELSHLSLAGLYKSPASLSLQRVLIPIARSLTILMQLLGTRESVRTWMNSPHPDLGGRTPISVILEGKGRAVSEMLEASLEGQLS